MVAQALYLPPERDIISWKLSEKSLRHYIRQAWHVVEPATPFVPGFHLDAIADHLEAVTLGQIRNLLINVPPRHMKSLAVSVFWPTWEWIDHPERRWLYSAYALSLSIRDSLKCRRLIESPWYQERWGDRFQLTTDQNVKARYDNDRTGYRIATSVGGAATGEGGDRVVVDDPHSAMEAASETVRTGTLTWWDETMSTRLNDPRTGAKVIVMQRLHEQDLSGHVLAQGGYEHLCLPAEYEPTTMVTGIGWSDPRKQPGELLWPQRFGRPEIEALKRTLGSHAASGQLQQRPAPAEGAILKRHWWQTWRAPLPPLDWMLQTWDTAFKTGQENDYSASMTLALAGPNIYVLDCWRERVEFPGLERAVRERFTRWQPEEIVVEDAASGQSLLQQLRRQANPDDPFSPPPLPLVAYRPDRDKIARAHAVSPYLEAGRLFLPEGAPWVDDFLHETALFPGGQHDDQVDALTIGVLRLAERLGLLRSVDATIAASWGDMPA